MTGRGILKIIVKLILLNYEDQIKNMEAKKFDGKGAFCKVQA